VESLQFTVFFDSQFEVSVLHGGDACRRRVSRRATGVRLRRNCRRQSDKEHCNQY
jgi:hypothetical protein